MAHLMNFMHRTWVRSPTPEDVFIERYEKLLAWALHLAHQDREQAEDLVHDAFIQFTLTQLDLKDIHNLDGYLYRILRNVHVSQLRRSGQRHLQQLSIVEYDSALIGLHSTEQRDQIQVQDELRRVCQYACARKESAMAASVLILRFFHGYYPSEISAVLQSSSNAVSVRLRMARREAKVFTRAPEQLGFLRNQTTEILPTNFARSIDDLLRELRLMIFRSRRGDCITREQVRGIYAGRQALETTTLAHIVSCRSCLDEINQHLNLPLLASRSPEETLGIDTRGRGGPPSGSGRVSAGETRSGKARFEQKRRDILEHEPQELCISVNGFIQALHKISSQVTEHTLVVGPVDRIDFVEVLSEQGVRLVLLSVAELPPHGPIKLGHTVVLSNDRSVTLDLSFDSPYPTVHVVYHDPNFIEIDSAAALHDELDLKSITVQPQPKEHRRGPEYRVLVKLLFCSVPWSRLLQPGAVTLVFAAILISTVLWFYWHPRKSESGPTATDLLARSVKMDRRAALRPGEVLHRTLKVTEASAVGALIAERRIEIWQSVDRGLTARRTYDAQGRLIAGDWRRSGVQTLYQHGATPRLQLIPEKRASLLQSFADVWQLESSANEFSQLIRTPADARLEEFPSSYLITLTNTGTDVLVRASLLLDRADLRPLKEVLVLRQGQETRQYTLIETRLELQPASQVSPSIFEPEEELLSGGRSLPHLEVSSPEAKAVGVNTTVDNSANLELEVTYLLDQCRANLGEQISVLRLPNGKLSIQGIVDSDRRKSEILKTLAPVSHHPSISIRLQTVDEALKSQRHQPSRSVLAGTLSAVNAGALPVDAELRRYLTGKGVTSEHLDEEIRIFSNRMLARSRNVMQHAFALKRLSEQFTPEQIDTLSLGARAKRWSILREHAQQLEQGMRLLRAEVQPVIRSLPFTPRDRREQGVTNESQLRDAIRLLFSTSEYCDRAIGSAFAISSEPAHGAAINDVKFWQSLQTAEQLATSIQNARLSDQ